MTVKKNTPTQEAPKAIITRSAEIIAAEIRSIDTQAREFVLRSAMEIGAKLNEVKSLVPHGDWKNWLQQNVSYSQSTANNFMRIATEYDGNSQVIANLSYSQAVVLLGMPAEDRETFVEENNASEMSSRELAAAVKEKQELERQLKEEQERVQKEQLAREEETKQREALYEQYQAELKLRQDQEKLVLDLQNAAAKPEAKASVKAADVKSKSELKKAEKELAESQERIATLEAEMKAKEEEMVNKLQEKIQERDKEMTEQTRKREEETAKQIRDMEEQLRKNNNTAAIKVKVHFDALVINFKDLIGAVSVLENEEQKQAIQSRIAALCDEMKVQL